MTPPATTRYEAEFARLSGAERAVAFAYARTGLQEAAAACGLAPGDRILLAPLNCKVVPLALLQRGYQVGYADVSAQTLNLDPDAVDRELAAGARAVVFQHTYGSSAGLAAVARVASARGALLFEDRAQCIAQFFPPVGRVAVYSNNLRKPLPAGSGGVAVTADAELASRLAQARDRLPARGVRAETALLLETIAHDRILRPPLYWKIWNLNRVLRPFHREVSFEQELRSEGAETALRASERQIARGRRSLRLAPELAKQRLACSEYYARRLAELGSEAELPIPAPREPLYYFPILSRRKTWLLEEARRRSLELIAWPLSAPIYPVERNEELARYGYRMGSCPVAERIAGQLVGLPTDEHATLTRRDALVELICTP